MTFLQEIEDRQERGEGVKFETAMPKIPFRPPQPPSEEEPAESSRPIEREARSLSPLLDKSPDILSMMGHILGKTSEPGKSPKWKLEQLLLRNGSKGAKWAGTQTEREEATKRNHLGMGRGDRFSLIFFKAGAGLVGGRG